MTSHLFRTIRRFLPATVAALLFVAGLVPLGEGFAQSIRKDTFNHLTTGFQLTGAHEKTKCENCHLLGIFKGTPKDCLHCHGPAARTSAITMTPNHIPVVEKCETCHNTVQFYGAHFNHSTVIPGNCTQCHNGTTSAPGKPARHIVTVASCDSCHRIMTWLPATFSHNSVAPGSCAQCHNGTTATGRSATHLITSSSCDSCHTTSAWIPGVRFDHTGVIPGTCTQCHDGTHAPGQKPGHPVTNSACDACHSPTGWLPARVDHSTVVPGTCAMCHNGTIATGKKFNHIPTTLSCDKCHSPGAWLPTTFKHQGVAQGTCATCHNGTIATGKAATHLVTSKSCDSCHSIAGWLPVSFDHKGVASGSCGNCHNGINATGKTATHVPVTGNACDACHTNTNYVNFGGTTMNHGAVQGVACTTCHEAGTSFFSGTVVTRPSVKVDPLHPLTGDCGACHTTSSFGGASAKPPNHLPTSKACALCHTNPGTYTGGVMNHQGITNNCAQCHGPGISFVGVTPKSPPTNHIPATGIACEGCHSVNNFTTFANTAINHASVPAIACQTCHETGKTWFGVTIVTRPTAAADPNHPNTGDCVACHNTTSFSVVTTKPANHLPTSKPCALCHTTPGVYTGGVMNHQGITNNCAQCHGPGISFVGVTPVSTPPTHIPTTGIACESCHSATNFSTFGATLMNHAGTGAIACQACHETGKTWYGLSIVTRPTAAADPTHPTTGDCGGSCHNTTSFGGFAKPANHIPTILGCTTCHSNLQNFKTYVMSHQGIASNCAQCHGPGLVFATNFVPKAPPANHIPSGAVACESCHSPTKFTAFSGTLMNHAGTGAIACQSCHETGMTWFGITTVTRPTAAADPNHPKPGTGDCGACHSTVTFSSPTAKPPSHIPTTLACATCHTNPADYKIYTMSHQGIASNCAQCHGPGLVFANNFVPKAPPPTHIPSGALACESCHSPTKFTAFSGTLMNHAGTGAIPCQTCHETGMAWFGITTVTRPTAAADPNHPKPGTGDCGACHTTTSFATVTAKPANHIPTTLACTVCHSNPANYKIYTMNHQGITSGCATCHGPGLVFATNFVPKAPPSNHIPTNAAACEGCHSASNFTAFSGTVMTPTMHNVVAAITCATCHETGKTFFGVTIVTRPTTATHPKTGDCVACHTTTPPFKGDTKPPNHIPTSQTCSLCHTTTDYSKAVMNHLGITSNCAQCHGPGLSFANIVPKAPPSNHVPYNGLACEACHLATNFTAFSGTTMKHAGITGTCISCHTDTTIANTSYFGVSIVTSGSKGVHLPLTYGVTNCGTCHASPYDPPTATFLNGISSSSKIFHTYATVPVGGCLPCHQSPAQIKPVGPEKITTMSASHNGGKSCDGAKCHKVTDSQFKSAQLAPAAADPRAAPKPLVAAAAAAASVPSARQTNPFPQSAQGSAVNPHTAALPGGCATCHNGVAAHAKPAKHLTTQLSCDSCHRTTTWIPASYRHAGAVPGQCATCHNNVGAKAKPVKHVLTTQSCDTCHRTNAWIPLLPSATAPAGARQQPKPMVPR